MTDFVLSYTNLYFLRIQTAIFVLITTALALLNPSGTAAQGYGHTTSPHTHSTTHSTRTSIPMAHTAYSKTGTSSSKTPTSHSGTSSAHSGYSSSRYGAPNTANNKTDHQHSSYPTYSTHTTGTYDASAHKAAVKKKAIAAKKKAAEPEIKSVNRLISPPKPKAPKTVKPIGPFVTR